MNIQSNVPQALGFTPRQTQAAFNQSMAQAHQASADARKGLDVPGVSRGAGHGYMANIRSAQSLADGIQQAYSQNIQDQAANANIGLNNAVASESLGIGVGAMAQQQQYANALAALQRQQQAMSGNVLGGLLGGGLDKFLGY